MQSRELYHHGIRGQRWGKRNGPPYPLKPSAYSAKEKQLTNFSGSTKNVVTPRKKRKGLSTTQKTAIKVGAALAVTALAAYGGYKLYQYRQINKNLYDFKSDELYKTLHTPIYDIYADVDESVDPHTFDYLIDDKWNKSVTKIEEQALHLYTESKYDVINNALRHNELFADPLDYVDHINYDDVIKNIDSSLARYELKEPQIFKRYSSYSMLGGASTEEEIRKMIGSVIHDSGFTSSTPGSNLVDEYFKNKQVLYKISTPAGTGIGAYIKSFSQKPNENEFLFARGSDFEITDVATVGGQLVVNLLYRGRS